MLQPQECKKVKIWQLVPLKRHWIQNRWLCNYYTWLLPKRRINTSPEPNSANISFLLLHPKLSLPPLPSKARSQPEIPTTRPAPQKHYQLTGLIYLLLPSHRTQIVAAYPNHQEGNSTTKEYIKSKTTTRNPHHPVQPHRSIINSDWSNISLSPIPPDPNLCCLPQMIKKIAQQPRK